MLSQTWRFSGDELQCLEVQLSIHSHHGCDECASLSLHEKNLQEQQLLKFSPPFSLRFVNNQGIQPLVTLNSTKVIRAK